MIKRLLLTFLISTTLSGCGFALRGNIALPDTLKTVAVLGDDADLVNQLEDTLRRSDVTVTTADNENAVQIDLGEVRYQRSVNSTDSNGRATSYNLNYKVEYNVIAANGTALQTDQRISQTRLLDYNPEQELQSQEEEEFLQQEMREEIVLQLIRRLTRL